jgi:hypothetical protein
LVARSRANGCGPAHDLKDQTMNALIFTRNTRAALERVETLAAADPAVMAAGLAGGWLEPLQAALDADDDARAAREVDAKFSELVGKFV